MPDGFVLTVRLDFSKIDMAYGPYLPYEKWTWVPPRVYRCYIGLYSDNGKETGNYSLRCRVPSRE